MGKTRQIPALRVVFPHRTFFFCDFLKFFFSFFFFSRVLQGRELAQSSITSNGTNFNGIKVLRSRMAGRNVGKLFQRVCQPSKNFIVQSCQAAKPTATPRAKNPLWLLAAAPFVNDSLIVEETQMVDEEEGDYEYEYENDIERNWSENAEYQPQNRKKKKGNKMNLTAAHSSSSAQPPPPSFPALPDGFCVDADKVPPIPPMLPSL